jgi:deoxyinosine 3'endonuclease (endonuclease V)
MLLPPVIPYHVTVMKAALDVHYENDGAIAACVVFKSWQDSEPSDVIRSIVPASKEYHAGRLLITASKDIAAFPRIPLCRISNQG